MLPGNAGKESLDESHIAVVTATPLIVVPVVKNVIGNDSLIEMGKAEKVIYDLITLLKKFLKNL